MWLYALTTLAGAFLLFQVQPLMGKWLLPWFGGGSAVWTVCMLFFQAALLGGYAYAHAVRTYLGSRAQVVVHAAVAAAAVALLPIGPSAFWRPQGTEDPTWRVLGVLATGVGLPYFALAATSPLLQAWFSTARPGASPYRLYAVSNAGSLLALATYPLLVEPTLGLRMQAAAWSAGLAAWAVLCVGCGVMVWRARAAGAGSAAPAAAPGALAGAADGILPPAADGAALGTALGAADCPADGAAPGAADCPADGASPGAAPPRGSAGAADAGPPGLGARLLWVALPACGSVLLLAVTNQMCSDVGTLPLLWVLPLALYLVSFIVVFHSDRLYVRPVGWLLLVAAVPVFLWLLDENVEVSLRVQVVGYGGGLLVACLVCHGELVRLRPSPRHLTSFYLSIAAGGAAGGVLVAVAAPMVLSAYYELHAGLWACLALAAVAYAYERRAWRWRSRPARVALVVVSAGVLVGAGWGLIGDVRRQRRDTIWAGRNFYGVLHVIENGGGTELGLCRTLRHGSVLHGLQYVEHNLRYQPTTYYGDHSGVGLAMHLRRGVPARAMRVGVVGLGTGSLAAHGRTGDVFRFYEINPDVRLLATTTFTYLAESAARCEVVLGDARLSMEREPPQEYDLLALDAFTGDAIPLHLLTAEALETYRRHLKPDGVLAIHISNRFLDLEPVVLALADHAGLGAAVINTDDLGQEELSGSLWVLLTDDRALLAEETIVRAASTTEPGPGARRLWTDDRSDLMGVLKTD